MPYKDKKNRICGFIDVEEKEKSSKFVRRYMRLDSSKGILDWFADNPTNLAAATGPCSTVDVNYITKVDIQVKTKSKAKYCFAVNTPMRKYFFVAIDETDMKEWVEYLNNASKITVSDEEPDLNSNNNTETTVNLVSESSDYSYKTEIVAGVVIQKKLTTSDDHSPKLIRTVTIDDKQSDTVTTVKSHIPLGRTFSSSDVLKEGWAVKQGHVRKNWKRRYFVLTKSHFSYYKSDHDKDPIRYIHVSDILTAKVDDTFQSEHSDNLFLVATTDRIYYIQADSPSDMESWVKLFNDIVKKYNSLRNHSKHEIKQSKDQGRRGTSAILDVPRRRKVDTLASSTQRNSTQVFFGKKSKSPISYYRLSTTEEVMGSSQNTLERRSKRRNSSKKSLTDHRNVTSSSEESIRLSSSSSIDCLTNEFSESKMLNTSSGKGSSLGKDKCFKRSCSGSDIITLRETTVTSPIREIEPSDEQDGNRRSFPLSTENVHVNENLSSSASFSTPPKTNETERLQLSSQSFCCTNPRARTSRYFYLDPKVDHRAAVKPSLVKKKRNQGILFTLNNMLNKKAEKMNRSKKKRN